MNDYMLQIVLAIISIIGVIITSVLIPFIKSKTTREQQERIISLIEIAVYAAEQIYAMDPESGDDKKAWVVKYLKARGITVSDAQIDAIIESIVYQMNLLQNNARQ